MPARTTEAEAAGASEDLVVLRGKHDVAALLRRLSATYCWDSSPDRALEEADRVILRTCNVGTWEDTLELERVIGRPAIRASLARASAGVLTPRAWSFWHYRLGLADAAHPPPPPPSRPLG